MPISPIWTACAARLPPSNRRHHHRGGGDLAESAQSGFHPHAPESAAEDAGEAVGQRGAEAGEDGPERLRRPGEGAAEAATATAGSAVYATTFFGKDGFGIIDPDGGGLRMIH